jgi:hypothetical protein
MIMIMMIMMMIMMMTMMIMMMMMMMIPGISIAIRSLITTPRDLNASILNGLLVTNLNNNDNDDDNDNDNDNDDDDDYLIDGILRSFKISS